MVRIRKIVTADTRSRLTLGSAIVRPGEQFRIERYPDGHITLYPVEITDAPQYEQGVLVTPETEEDSIESHTAPRTPPEPEGDTPESLGRMYGIAGITPTMGIPVQSRRGLNSDPLPHNTIIQEVQIAPQSLIELYHSQALSRPHTGISY